MTQLRNLILAGALGGSVLLTGCSSLGKLTGSKKKAEADAADKAGRITMVLDDEVLTANPELATTPVELPEAIVMESWPQAGSNAAKVVGHVSAGAELSVAWRNGVGSGSDKKSAMATPPVASETTVFTLDAEQRLVATDLASGSTVWQKRLKGDNKRDKIALGGGLAVNGDTLIVASGYGFVARLSAADGSELWRTKMNAPMTGAPTVKDADIFVASNNNEVFSLSLETGEVKWSDQAISETARVLGSSSPAAVEDFVIAPYSSGEIIAYLASNGRRLWSDAISQAGRYTPISEINDIGSRPVLSSGMVFASSQSGVTVAIDGRSGNRVWNQSIGSAQAPALAGRFMFVVGNDGRLACLNAANGEAYWVVDLPRFEKEKKKKGRISYSGPLLASGNVILVSSTGELLAFSPQTGEQTGSVKIGQSVYIEPIAVQDKILVLTDEARLIAIK